MELFQGNGQLDEDVEDILYELGNVGVAQRLVQCLVCGQKSVSR